MNVVVVLIIVVKLLLFSRIVEMDGLHTKTDELRQ